MSHELNVQEISARVASFVRACAEQGLEGAAEARGANMRLAHQVVEQGMDSDAGAMVYLLILAFEAGRQTGRPPKERARDVALAEQILEQLELGNDPRAESKLLAERVAGYRRD